MSLVATSGTFRQKTKAPRVARNSTMPVFISWLMPHASSSLSELPEVTSVETTTSARPNSAEVLRSPRTWTVGKAVGGTR